MIELRYRAHREIYRLTVDLENEAPQIFIGDQNISDLINSADYQAIKTQAERIAAEERENDRGEYLYAMGYRR